MLRKWDAIQCLIFFWRGEGVNINVFQKLAYGMVSINMMFDATDVYPIKH